MTVTVAAPLPEPPAAAVGAEGLAGGAAKMSGVPFVTVGVIFDTLLWLQLAVYRLPAESTAIAIGLAPVAARMVDVPPGVIFDTFLVPSLVV